MYVQRLFIIDVPHEVPSCIEGKAVSIGRQKLYAMKPQILTVTLFQTGEVM